jgi:uncharacterized protein (DUF362 family)
MSIKSRTRVGFVHGEDRRRSVYQAMELVRHDIVAKLKPQLLIKPNFLSSTNQLASSHVDAVRGILDFLQTVPNAPQEIVIAEGGNEKYSGEALENFGYHALVDESPIPIRLVDLHQETEWVETTIVLADNSEATVKMPKLILDIPCKLSLAVAKTHDACVVTLAVKNMIMGTLYKPDRIKMHGFKSHAERTLPVEAQVLNINLIRLARYLWTDIAVIDGVQGLQGDGPGGTDGVDFKVAAASADVFAADAVVAKAMGFEPLELGLLHYGNELGMGIADLNRIDVLQTPIASVQTAFKPHSTVDLQMQWHAPEPMRAYLTA